jgi:hypothetical protein
MVIITSQTAHEKFPPASHRATKKTAAVIAKRTSTFLAPHIMMFSIRHLPSSKCHERNPCALALNTINIKIVLVIALALLFSGVKLFERPSCKIFQWRSELAQTEVQETWITNQKGIDFQECLEASSMPEFYPWRILAGILTRSSFKGLSSLFAPGLKLLIVLTLEFRESESF